MSILKKASALCLLSALPLSLLAAPFDWQGSYFGGYVGVGIGSSHTSTNTGSVTDTSYFSNNTDINSINNSGTFNSTPVNFIGGIKVSHNWEAKKIIYGAVMDFGSLALKASRDTTNANYSDDAGQYTFNTSIQTNWLFTLRAKIGYPLLLEKIPSLLYLTGGMALSRYSISNYFSDNTANGGLGNIQNNAYELGWVLGIGMDFRALTHLIINATYLHVGLPSVTTGGSISNSTAGFGTPAGSQNSPFTVTRDFDADILETGLSYHFSE